MDWKRKILYGLAAFLVFAAAVAPAGATTLVRMGIKELATQNASIVSGTVVDVQSYWNAEGTFILSDVRLVADDVLKGDAKRKEWTFTVMGGTVGDLSTVIVGGPEIVPGNSYVVFLSEEDLPGARATTVRDLCQGIFDVRPGASGARAVSQAIHHPLLRDASGVAEAPGGVDGIAIGEFRRQVRLSTGNR